MAGVENSLSLGGRVALVTGAGQGIGKAVTLRLAGIGADIVVADVNPETARSVAEEVRRLGREAMDVQVDVSIPSRLRAMADAAVDRFGRIDILVACAGIGQIKDILEITEEDWDRVLGINADIDLHVHGLRT